MTSWAHPPPPPTHPPQTNPQNMHSSHNRFLMDGFPYHDPQYVSANLTNIFIHCNLFDFPWFRFRKVDLVVVVTMLWECKTHQRKWEWELTIERKSCENVLCGKENEKCAYVKLKSLSCENLKLAKESESCENVQITGAGESCDTIKLREKSESCENVKLSKESDSYENVKLTKESELVSNRILTVASLFCCRLPEFNKKWSICCKKTDFHPIFNAKPQKETAIIVTRQIEGIVTWYNSLCSEYKWLCTNISATRPVWGVVGWEVKVCFLRLLTWRGLSNVGILNVPAKRIANIMYSCRIRLFTATIILPMLLLSFLCCFLGVSIQKLSPLFPPTL